MNTQSIVSQLGDKIQECLEGFQQELDSSYSRIEAFLDQLSLIPNTPVPQNNDNFVSQVIQISQPLIQILANQVIHELKPLINLNIQEQIQQTQLQLQQQLIQKQKISQPIIIDHQHQLNLKSFTYNLLQSKSIKQSENCQAIAINKDNSIVLAGCNKLIKVFKFQQEILKQTQLLNEHTGDVTTLNFMQKQNQFVSGSQYGQIIIWSMNENIQWVCQQKLNAHSQYINCLVISNNEQFIISGSNDKTIKFWYQQCQQFLCQQTILDHTQNVEGLSLNDLQNRLISCGYDNLILIIERLSQDQKWNVVQRIQVQQFGRRICFIGDNVFTFQPTLKQHMHVYEMNSTNKQYSKTKEIDVKSGYNGCDYWFPQQFIKKKSLVVNKNGQNVNLIRKNQNGDFITQQSIDFGHNNIYGQMSEDGEYLMTWDEKSKEIQIRKYYQE
ncbi:unnamed protein product [Paramecium primaurelia]|uniref:Uncharacterized protein n=1 Tax=Paramecium primaurelia TaxID=5886 RepID=A0A8S1N9L2_PARPR|nr:unnamed protein product [Paramecium primaurelia]